ncbi:hypothetical protein FQZ97_1114710 [compost metagenome]
MPTVGQQAARSRGQFEFTDQPTLAGQGAFQFAQVGLDVAVGLQLLHQHIENAAAGQADRRLAVAAVAVAHRLHRLGKGTGGQAFEKVVLHAAAGQRTYQCPFAVAASSEPGARGAEP